jgi:hypothetical protein
MMQWIRAMAVGRIDPSVPWVKSNAVAMLIQEYPSEEVAMQKIAAGLSEQLAGKSQLPNIISEVQRIYRANFFPEMKADWRAYPDNLNHKDGAGCFPMSRRLAQNCRWQREDSSERLQLLPHDSRSG